MFALLRTFSLQELLHHPWRTASALLAVVLGVALGFAVHVINASALDEFSRAVRSVQGQPDLELRAMQGALPEAVYSLVAREHQWVAQATPWLEASVQAAPHDAALATPVTLRLLGGDALQLAALAPALMPQLFAGHDRLDLFAPDTVFLNAAALQALGLSEAQAPGTQLKWRLPTSGQGIHTAPVRIAGTVAASGPPLAVMDIGAMQDLLQRWGQVSRVDLLLTPGAHTDQLLEHLRAQPGWPPGVLASVPGNDQQRVAQMSRAYRVNLTVLALVALFTGAFLVFSVLSLSVARRAPQFALLAVLGLTARARLALVLAESAVLGVLGSAGGIALGWGLAALALHLLGGDLGGGYFTGVQPAPQWSGGAALVFTSLGVAATLAGGWWPARTAQTLPPAATLKGLGALQVGQSRARLPLLLLLASAALAWLPPIAGIPLAAYVSVGLLLLGGLAALPWLLGRLLQRLPAFASRNLLWLLAFERARRMRASASVAVGGVVASLSLAVALTVMVSSFRGSMGEWLDTALPAPAYVRAVGGTSQGDIALFDAALTEAVGALPGVARAQGLRNASLALDSRQPALALLVRPLQGAQAQQLPWLAPPLAVPPGLIGVHVSEAAAQLYGLQPGQHWPALQAAFTQTREPAREFFIAGIWRDYVRQFGAVAMDSGDYQRLTHDTRVSEVALWPAEHADIAALQTQIQSLARTHGPLEWVSSSRLRERSMRIFDRSFAVTYWLQAVAIGIGLFGIAASFSAQVFARRKEFGLLNHLGLTRRQILGVVAGEGAVWSGLGALAGTTLGLGVAVILVHVVNPQSFHWTMELRVPWLRLALLALAVTAAGTLAAWLAGRQAASRNAVQAVKEDW